VLKHPASSDHDDDVQDARDRAEVARVAVRGAGVDFINQFLAEIFK
jgi:hypothetical protein